MSDAICTIAELEAVLGTTPLGAQMKEIDHIDEGAARWIAASPLAFVVGSGKAVRVTLAGGPVGFARVGADATLAVPASMVDEPEALNEGAGAAFLFVVPGVTETLRVNGRVVATGDEIRIAPDEVFIHCGKALIRSAFWDAEPLSAPGATAFVDGARFVALATSDETGRADMSPKGDPAGAMLRRSGEAVLFADRPGNRRADGFRNILKQPQAAALALIPGSTQVARLSGQVSLSRDEAARAAFTVEDKTPLLVSVMEPARVELFESGALARARLWPMVAGRAQGIDPSEILVGHVKANRQKGEDAKAIRDGVAVDGVRQGLELSYKHRLY